MKKVQILVLITGVVMFIIGFGTGNMYTEGNMLSRETKDVLAWAFSLEYGEDLPGSFEQFADSLYLEGVHPFWAVRAVQSVEESLEDPETYDQLVMSQDPSVLVELGWLKKDMIKKIENPNL